MGAARQILRYSIPGSIVLLHGIACFLIYRRFQDEPFVASATVLDENVGALLVILAAIPIGFVVYQAYYFSYSPLIRLWPRSWQGRLVRPDRGSEILAALQPDQIKALKAIFDPKLDVSESHQPVQSAKTWRRRRPHWILRRLGVRELRPDWKLPHGNRTAVGIAYSTRWHANWNTVRAILDIANSTKGGRQIKQEYTTLSDIYHAIGAARTAFVFGFLGVVALVPFSLERFVDHPGCSLLGLFVGLCLTGGIYVILHLARARTWQTASSALRLGLPWFFWVHVEDFLPSVPKGTTPPDAWLREALRTKMPPPPP